jgi:hypothetical protein
MSEQSTDLLPRRLVAERVERARRHRRRLDAARRFAHDDASLTHRSLFKGTLGLTYLGLRLREPLRYPMPGLGLLSAS